jgi:flagellar secretion chaperone FliS
MENKLRNYQAGDTLGRSGVELVVKVYDGALNCLRRARENYSNENRPAGYDNLEQAKKFIVHLYTTLDEKNGGEIAYKLGRLYVFVIEKLNTVQATGDVNLIDDSIEIIGNLLEGWSELAGRQALEKNKTVDKNTESKNNLSLSV